MGKILAVDDEEEMLELVKMALERDGHQREIAALSYKEKEDVYR